MAAATPLERHFDNPPARPTAWLKAARPHQWSKNALVLAPLALGFSQLTQAGVFATVATMVLFCLLSSFTYLLNDIADLAADRRHPRKRTRPFASAELRVRSGLLAGGIGIPAVLLAAFLISPAVALCLLAYLGLTLSYSVWLKRAAILDCFTIGSLFTLRLAAGVVAASLAWSPWLLTFSVSFFFSLALAKRHTELVGRGPTATGPVPGRGYRYEDQSLTLVLGVAAFTVSILISILYLMEEVFPRGAYAHPSWLWVAPPVLFLWVSRVWLLAHRGEMHDDPVIYALKDRVSQLLGLVVAAAFLLALL